MALPDPLTMNQNDKNIVKYSGVDDEMTAENFIVLIEQKLNYALDPVANIGAGADNAARAAHNVLVQNDFRKRKGYFHACLTQNAFEWLRIETNNIATWEALREAFIARFQDDKLKYKWQISVKNAKRTPNETIPSFAYRIQQGVNVGWPHLNQEQRNAKYMEFFIDGLTPVALKREVCKHRIEHDELTWANLKAHATTKDLSLQMSAEFTNGQYKDTDKVLALESEINALKERISQTTINAVNVTDAKNDISRQNQTRFCTDCKRSGHTKQFCFKRKARQREDEKRRNQQKPNFRRPNRYNSNQNYNNRRLREQSHDRNYNDNRSNRNDKRYNDGENRRRTYEAQNNRRNNYQSRSHSRDSQYNRRYPSNNRDAPNTNPSQPPRSDSPYPRHQDQHYSANVVNAHNTVSLN